MKPTPANASTSVLDDDLELVDTLVASLADARDAAPGGLAPDRDAAMRSALLGRIHAEDAAAAPVSIAGLLTTPVPDHDWQPIWPGVRMHVLHDHGTEQSFLLRLDAGATIPPHSHAGEELCVVLEGEIELEDTVGRPGTFHLAQPGSHHRNLRARTGCLLYLRASLDHGMRF
jgi:putative transcriptional regulator